MNKIINTSPISNRFDSSDVQLNISHKISLYSSLKQIKNAAWERDASDSGNFLRIKNRTVKVYRFGEQLGIGCSGKVNILIPCDQGKAKAIKTLSLSIRHPNKLRDEYAICLSWTKNAAGLALKPKAYLPGGGGHPPQMIMHKYDTSLSKLASKLPIENKIEALRQVIDGICTLHSLRIIHGDIHAGNILFDKAKNRFDLLDFGLSKPFTDPSEVYTDLKDMQLVIKRLFLGLAQFSNEENKFNYLVNKGLDPFAADSAISLINKTYSSADELKKDFTDFRALFAAR